jgi:hypothetical protein
LGLADDRQHIGRIAIRLGLHGAHGILAGLVEPWVTEGDPTGLGGRKRLTSARGNERALLLGQRGKQVKHEGVNVGAKLGDQERHLVNHQT